MKTSEQINEIAAALAKARGEFPPIEKNCEVRVKLKTGGEYTYRYADKTQINKHVDPILSKHGLAPVGGTVEDLDKGITLVVIRLIHLSGQWIQVEKAMPQMTNKESEAAYVTFVDRHLLGKILGVAAEDDIDGGNGEVQEFNTKHPKPQSSTPQSERTGALSEKQLKRLFAIQKANEANGWNQESVKDYMRIAFNITSSKELNKGQYETLCDLIQSSTYETALTEVTQSTFSSDVL